MSLPSISLVGRPNVGKSTLFNRLSRSRQALVSDFEGLTRDRQYATAELNEEVQARIIDTGGLTGDDNVVDNGIEGQVLSALEESDAIYFIVSARDGLTTLDRDIAAELKNPFSWSATKPKAWIFHMQLSSTNWVWVIRS